MERFQFEEDALKLNYKLLGSLRSLVFVLLRKESKFFWPQSKGILRGFSVSEVMKSLPAAEANFSSLSFVEKELNA